MAGSVNKCILLGSIDGEPNTQQGGGDPVVEFSLATAEIWTDRNGQPQERTVSHMVEVSGRSAQTLANELEKGSWVYLEGSLTYDEVPQNDGSKKYVARVRVGGFGTRVTVLGRLT